MNNICLTDDHIKFEHLNFGRENTFFSVSNDDEYSWVFHPYTAFHILMERGAHAVREMIYM